MNKEKEMREAIKNFHKLYYSDGANFSTPEGMAELHHAASHLFDAAEITSSVASDEFVKKSWVDVFEGRKPSEDLKKCWKKIRHSK